MAQRTTGLRGVLSARWAYSGFQTLVGARRYYRMLVAEHLGVAPCDRVLDIGCGPADILEFLGPVDYVGFDTESRYITSAQARWADRTASFSLGDVGDLGVDGLGRFDVVLAVGVLHHLDDGPAARLFDVAARLLRPEGRVVTVDPCLEERQHPVASLLIRNDRGQNVRTAAGYAALADGLLGDVDVTVRHDLLHVPYSHAIVSARQDGRP